MNGSVAAHDIWSKILGLNGNRVAGVWRTLTVIGVIFTAGALLAGWISLPGDNARRLTTLEVQVDTIKNEYRVLHDQLVSIQTMNRQQLCLDLAAKLNHDWRECVLAPRALIDAWQQQGTMKP